MRIVFMGNPEFALPSLFALCESTHDVVSVVTSPDKAQGRGMRPKPVPVAMFAKNNKLSLIQPDALKDESLVADLGDLAADLFVVVAFKILPEKLLSIPRLGCVNLHGSLLPQYRGAAPIHRALVNGDTLTGLTTFILAPKVDTGDILLTKKVVIFPDDDYGTLSRRMAILGAGLVLETIEKLSSGVAEPIPQNDSAASKAPKIKPDEYEIDWKKPARKIRNLIRALAPTPGAYSFINGKRVKVFRAGISGKFPSLPGQIVFVGKDELVVSCGDGCLDLQEVQLEGKRRAGVKEFLLGARLAVGDRLGP